MDDEAGGDAKLLAVPIDKILPIYTHWQKPEDMNQMRLKQIQHFFEHYKDLEPGKWVKVNGWEGPEAARAEVSDGIASYREHGRARAERLTVESGAQACRRRLERPALVQLVEVARRRPRLRARGSRRPRARTADARASAPTQVCTGSRPRAILCSPCAPPSKRW